MTRDSLYPGGSSPLARGLLSHQSVGLLTHGIIPARAGFTMMHSTESHPCPDHPRSRGVYVLAAASACALFGSSPLARGLHGAPDQDGGRDGIIPARAGFTSTRTPGSSISWDHPRSRGVYHPVPPGGLPVEGSSPLARGLRRCGPRPSARCRIIPARAGFTIVDKIKPALTRDHPRSRGVYVPGGAESVQSRGIIPARAGFTPTAESADSGP